MAMLKINTEVMEFMVWVIELVAHEFFDGDKVRAYKMLNEHGLWAFFIQSYDITHSFGANIIVGEVREVLTAKGVI